MGPQLVLASGSPRRAKILDALGISFRVVVPDVDENPLPGEEGAALAERLSRAKATVVATRRQADSLPVLAADTVVVCGERLLAKPEGHRDAVEMLRLLSGRSHDVLTGVSVAHAGRLVSGVERTSVSFAPMSDAEIEAYVATCEPMDKAGGYHIDGRGALFVTGIEGSPSNVAGLPVRLVLRLLREVGVDLASAGPR